MKFFLDTEFSEMGPYHPIRLISIGIVAEDGREFYAEHEHRDFLECNDWVKANVLPHLVGPPLPLSSIRDQIQSFVGDDKPEFWGYYADYDWVVFAQIFGTMMHLPKSWPMYCRDLKQWCDQLGNPSLPAQGSTEHNALNDARWNKAVYAFLVGSSDPIQHSFTVQLKSGREIHDENVRAEIARLKAEIKRLTEANMNMALEWSSKFEARVLDLSAEYRQMRDQADAAEAKLAELREEKWICFHCGFETANHAEAQAHFGDRDDAYEFTPTCTWWAKLTSEERAQEIQDLRQEITAEQEENSLLRTRIEGLEYRVDGQLSEIRSFKPFRQCTSVNEIFHLYDSMEGKALAAEAVIATLPTPERLEEMAELLAADCLTREDSRLCDFRAAELRAVAAAIREAAKHGR